MTHKLQLKNLVLSLVLALAMVAGALPFMTQTGHAAMYYKVYTENSENGKVTADPSEGLASGTTVTLTVAPENGYKLKTLSVIQPNVLGSISDLVDLMGNAQFTNTGNYSVKIEDGQFSIYDEGGNKIASLDNSSDFTNTYGSGGTYTVNTNNSFWAFYIIGGKLRSIYFINNVTELNFSGTGANTISGTEIETTVTEDGKYTFVAPPSNVFVTAEFKQNPKTVLIDVGEGHESLFTEGVLNQIKTGFDLEDVTISGNVVTLKGVDPSDTEDNLRGEIANFVYNLAFMDNGEEFINVAYKAIDEFATYKDYQDDTHDGKHGTTPVSEGLTYYLLWAMPYEKLEIDNGNPTCGKENWSALPTAPAVSG